MEQAINTFTGGLSIDTHPMVQNNDTLTDALNATVVTMNGNEVILQNDMGNRRVDHAYLPPGYEPVGIKEYGGIIYVASHNPITGKSQIGSFPSPQRMFGTRNIKEGELNVCSAFRRKQSEVGKVTLDCLDNESVLIPLSRMKNGPQNESRTKELEYVLHAGDKFVVYSSDIWGNNFFGKNNITNFNNISGTKIKSPKNKLFTLAIGVINSQNEFVDITSSLVRWDGTDIISKDPDKSDKYYFNKGYFIASGESPSFKRDINTAKDSEYIQNRKAAELLTSNANTYAYKLVGPLYLKATINHVQNFNYSLEGYFSSGKLYLWVFSTITYNCPDGITGGDGDDEYNSYEIQSNWPSDNASGEVISGGINPRIGEEINTGGIVSEIVIPIRSMSYTPTGTINPKDSSNVSSWYDLYIESQKLTSLACNQSKTSYNKETNLYTAQNRRLYIIQGDNLTKSSILDYTIAVKAHSELTGDCTPTYIEGLSSSGIIDISKLGTGEIELQGWRFYNYPENKQTVLTYELGAYPKYGKKFNGLQFKIWEVREDSNSIRTISSEETTYKLDLPANNGKTTIIFNWDTFKFDFRKLYKVEIKSLGESENSEIDKITPDTSQTNTISVTNDSSEVVKYPEILENSSLKRWILTTKLMNIAYNKSSNYFIQDYGYPHDNNEKDILDYLLTVRTKNIFSYIDNSQLEENRKTYYEDSNGQLQIDSEENYEYHWIKTSVVQDRIYDIRWEHTLNLDVQLSSKVTVDQIELYPDYIKEEQSYNTKYYSVDNQNYPFESTQEVEIVKKGFVGELNSEDFVEFKNIAISNNNYLEGKIILYDWFKCTFIQNNRPVLYPMDRVSKHLLELISSVKTFGGIGLDFENNNAGEIHYLDFYPPIEISKGMPTPLRCIDDYTDAINPHADRLNGNGVQSALPIVFNKDQYGDLIMAELNKFPANQMLVFCLACNGVQPSPSGYPEYELGNSALRAENNGYPIYNPTTSWWGSQFMCHEAKYITNDDINNQRIIPAWPTLKYCARVWWRGANGRWSLFEYPFNVGRSKNNSIQDLDMANYLNGVVYYGISSQGSGEFQSSTIYKGLWEYSNDNKLGYLIQENNINTEYLGLPLAEKLAYLIYDKVLNKKDFLYCFTNELSEDDDIIYIPNKAQCAYNNYYTSNVTIPIKFEYTLEDLKTVENTNYHIDIDNDYDPSTTGDNVSIQFKIQSNIQNNSNEPFEDSLNYIRTLESDKKFEKYTSMYTATGALSNIFIETGDIVNSYGEYFKPQLIYPIKFNGSYGEGNITFIDKFNNSFVTDINNPFLSILVKSDGTEMVQHNNRNIILFTKNNPGNPYYLYDVMGAVPNNINISFPFVQYDNTPSSNDTFMPHTGNIEKRGLTAMSFAGFNIVKYDK